jgi:Helix-turn-helix domain of resolvase
MSGPAEFERAMIRERVLAGLARAKQDGIHLGRKFIEDTKDGNRKIKAALAMRAKGIGIRKIAREVGLGVGTVLRLALARLGFCAKGHGLMSKNPRQATRATTAGNMPAQVRVRLKRINCQEAEPYPPDGQAPEWWQRLKNAFGTASSAFVDASLQQLIAAARLPNGGISVIAVNATLAFVEGAKPQSEVESALLMQMGCTHAAAMAVLGRVAGAHGPTRSIAAMASAAARLLRTYAIQVETWRRLRNGGSQFVRVEHVHVNEGGQAVVGTLAVGRSGAD